MKHSFKRVPNDACIGGIGCAVSEFAGVALKGICVLRTLVLVAAMVIGAASASARGGAQEISSLDDLKEACYGRKWDDVSDFKLTDNIVGDGTITLERSLTLDLDGHSITISEGSCFDIDNGKTLTIIDNSTGSTKGSVNHTDEDSGYAIYIMSGCGFSATGISITSKYQVAVHNGGGTATLTGCTLSGSKGLYNKGTASVIGGTISGTEEAIHVHSGTLSLNTDAGSAPCTISGGKYGLHVSGASSVSIGSDVSIKCCSTAGIYTTKDNITFTALPTFGTGDDKNGTDIWLADDNKITFSSGSYTAPTSPITISLADEDGNELSVDDLPKIFTQDYSNYVKEGDSIIDPAAVFAYANTSTGFAVAVNSSGEAAIFRGKTFAFAEGQTWMTWCDANDYQKPSGITAYRITGVSATAVTVEAVDDGTLPAYTPLLLMKKESGSLTAINLGAGNAPQTGYDDQTGIVTAGGTTDTGWAFYGNAGNNGIAAAAAIYTAEGGFLHVGRDATGTVSYVLRDGQFILVDQNQGLAAHRCLLNVSAGNSNARTLSIGKVEDVTGITTTDFTDYTDSDDVWYDLQGRRVSTPARGIYIQEGRKIVVK